MVLDEFARLVWNGSSLLSLWRFIFSSANAALFGMFVKYIVEANSEHRRG